MLFWPPFSIHIFPLIPLLVYGRVMTGIVGDDETELKSHGFEIKQTQHLTTDYLHLSDSCD